MFAMHLFLRIEIDGALPKVAAHVFSISVLVGHGPNRRPCSPSHVGFSVNVSQRVGGGSAAARSRPTGSSTSIYDLYVVSPSETPTIPCMHQRTRVACGVWQH